MSSFMDFLTGGISSVLPETVEATAPNVTASEPKADIASRLKQDLQRDFGLNDVQAAAFVGNLAHESGGFKSLQEIKPLIPGSRGGYGYAQWTGPRRRQFEGWTAEQGLDPSSYDANYGFLKHELSNTPEGRVLNSLRQANDPATATQIVSDQFLRPGIPGMGSRQRWTQRVLGGDAIGEEGAPGQNQALAYAATRGRDPRANMPAPDATQAMGQMQMPSRQMPPDLSNSPDGGARDFMLRQAGMAPDMQPSGPQGGGGGQSLVQMLMGAVGGGGGQQQMRQPDSIEALIPDNKPNPFAFMGEALMENQQAAQKRQGQIFAAKQLVAQGMSPQDAVAAINSPVIGQQLALGGLQQQRDARAQAAVRQRVYGGQPSQEASSAPQTEAPAAGPATSRPADAAMLGGKPAAAPATAPVERLTPKLTVDTLLRDRERVTREIENVYAIPTDKASEGIVEGRVKALNKRLENIDKGLEQYGTGPLKEYTLSMRQRIERGEALVPFEKFDPEAERKAARGPGSEEITGYRKEVQNLPSYKNMAQAAPVYNSMLEAAGRNTRSADVNLIYGMAKIMDPTSVVRESEMTVAQAIATLPDRLQQGARSLLNSEGRLSDEVRKGIMTEAYSRMNSYKGLFDTDTKLYDGIVGRRGINREDVIPSFGEFKPYKPPEKAAGADGATPQFKTGATATGRDGTKIRFDGTTWVPFQ